MDTGFRSGAVHNITDAEESDAQLSFHAEYLKIRHQLFATRTADAGTDNFHNFKYHLLVDCRQIQGTGKTLRHRLT